MSFTDATQLENSLNPQSSDHFIPISTYAPVGWDWGGSCYTHMSSLVALLSPLCAQVFTSRPTAHHGPHLCVAVLPLWADLGWQSLLAPPANPAHGQDDALQDLPGVPAELPPDLQLHPLPSSPSQPRRAHFKGIQRQQWRDRALCCHSGS